ncbi:cytochrome-c peroxidase [Winogradskyella sp. PG-2]|uniref:cytochrome-c peroxidase n=1 Tax=Winogradskyella sp. PG-2 TaxID=754409 RepID=UPI0004588F0E|nr:cytochrome-c peroxidase [Winogradskyella sp. PG-2]BAO74495.1 probable cytochrome-c peroxidase [Winogradskyella sp. PG-2]
MKSLCFKLLLILATLFVSCSSNNNDDYTDTEEGAFFELNLPETYFNYANIELPEHYTTNGFPSAFQFRAPIEYDNTPIDNPVTDAGATLGRVLFYDKKLSANSTISCASCHKSEHGFSDLDTLSEGFEGGLIRRHSMSIVNARFYADGRFFWDERAQTLEEQVLMPFQDDVEMGLTLQELIQIANEQSYYPILFKDAFGDSSITSDRISRALA